MKISFIIPCMGRLEQIKQTVTSVLAQPNSEYILVDYSCPDHCGDWIRQNYPQIKVVEVLNQTYYNSPASKNAGLVAATGELICSLDGDMILQPDFSDQIRKIYKECNFITFDSEEHGYSGMIVCSKLGFEASGGYDESFNDYGHDDNDFKQTLRRLGFSHLTVPRQLATHLDHGYDLRVAFFQNKDFQETRHRNLEHMLWKRTKDRPQDEKVIFKLHQTGGFGDTFRSIQEALYESATNGNKTVWINPMIENDRSIAEKIEKMLSILDFAPASVEISYGKPNRQIFFESPKPGPVPYFPTKNQWKFGPYKQICYQFDANWTAPMESADFDRILNSFPGYIMTPIGGHIPIPECINIATKSDLFIGANSGMAHLARSVRIPTLIARYNSQSATKIKIWHKEGDHYEECDGVDDLIAKAKSILGIAGN